MNIPFILDITIGLIFVYLITSLLASEVQELLTTLLQWRAAHLRKSIENLLVGGEGTNNDKIVKDIVKSLYENPLIKNISQDSKEGIEAVLRKVTRSIIKLNRNNLTLTEGNEPSYIPSETFATTLLERLELPQLVKKLTVLNLYKFVENEINSLIKNYVEDKSLQVDSDTREILKNDFNSLKKTFKEICTAFSTEKFTLSNTIIQLQDELNLYIEKSTIHLQSIFANEQNNTSTKRLIDQLIFLQKSTFHQSGSHNNTNELMQRLQPSLDQILALINTEENDQIIKTSKNLKAFKEEFKDVDTADFYQTFEIELLKISQRLPPAVKKSLTALVNRTHINLKRTQTQVRAIEDELRQFQIEIEVWFDRSMERASGVYKRNAKGVAFLIGFLLAWAVNADTFHIINRLAADSTLRSAIAENAEVVTSCQSPELGQKNSQLECIRQQINQSIPLPIGRDSVNLKQQHDESLSWFFPPLKRFLGWLVSGLAISMGASFWFELLGKIINVRNAGRPPEKPATSSQSDSK